MKIAYIHEWIINIGGAENVFFDLIKENPSDSGLIFCILSDKKHIKVGNKYIKIKPVLPRFIGKIFIAASKSENKIFKKFFDYRNLITFFPILMKILSFKLKIFNPNKVIISSFAASKNIDYKGYKVLYMHSPIQYVYSHYEENLEKLDGVIKKIYIFVCKYLKKWDAKYTDFTKVYFNSQYTQKLAKELYGIDGKVKYPKLNEEILATPASQNPNDYYIYMGRLVKFSKNVDKIIELFNQTGENLLIAGSGPDEEYLKSIAGDNIIFVGYVSNIEEKIKLIKKAKGLINLTLESYGIITAESLALGTPVLGYNGGGSQELVDSNSGILVDTKDQETLLTAFEKFRNTDWNRVEIKKSFMKKI